ncbi:MAG: hypothetical protein WC639_04995 [Patescibacteria group bacterium]|jgi:cell fate (sporulation/competence/biofilm development) regulator YlbF (YheA/YmcA/DUF963 family)
MNWELFFNFIGNLSQVALAIAAFLALNKWKEQMKGGGKYNVAKKLMVSFRKMQEIIEKKVRNPFLHPTEANKNQDDYNWQYFVYQKRFKEMYDYKINNFDEYSIEAEILLGDNVKNIISEFNKKINELSLALQCGYNIYRGDTKYEDERCWQMYSNKIRENQELLWNIEGEKNKYSPELEKIVNELKKELSQYIQ